MEKIIKVANTLLLIAITFFLALIYFKMPEAAKRGRRTPYYRVEVVGAVAVDVNEPIAPLPVQVEYPVDVNVNNTVEVEGSIYCN